MQLTEQEANELRALFDMEFTQGVTDDKVLTYIREEIEGLRETVRDLEDQLERAKAENKTALQFTAEDLERLAEVLDVAFTPGTTDPQKLVGTIIAEINALRKAKADLDTKLEGERARNRQHGGGDTSLSRSGRGSAGASRDHDPKVTKEMVAMANGQPADSQDEVTLSMVAMAEGRGAGDIGNHIVPVGDSRSGSASPDRLALSIAGAVALPLSATSPDSEGQPRRKFKKDLIRAGLYKHPVHGWTLDVTTDRMNRWVAAFQKMRSNGIDVEVVVDHSLAAEDVQGYLVDMFREGDVLYGVHDMIGEEAIELAERVKNVSVLIDKDFADGEARRYGEAITHSSIVQKPVVPNQGAFKPIAASFGGVPLLPLTEEQSATARMVALAGG